jgi:hypothetical protein
MGDLKDALKAVERPAPRRRRRTRARQVIVVLGMPGSGASRLTQLLHALGADMGESDDLGRSEMRQDSWQPDIVALLDEMLDLIGRPMANPAFSLPFPEDWWRGWEIDTIAKRLEELLADKLKRGGRVWGFNDRRTARLLPLWLKVFSSLGVQPRFLWAICSPGEIVRSGESNSARVVPPNLEQTEVGWLVHAHDILRHLAGKEPIIVDYRSWRSGPRRLAARLQKALDLPGLPTDSELNDFMRNLDHSWPTPASATTRLESTQEVTLGQKVFEEIANLSRTGFGDGVIASKPLLEDAVRMIEPFAEILANLPSGRPTARDNVQRLRRRLRQTTEDNKRLNERLGGPDSDERLPLAVERQRNLTAVWPKVLRNARPRVVYEAGTEYHERHERALTATNMASTDSAMRRLRHFGIEQAVRQAASIPGDALEVGCYRGLSAWQAADAFRRMGKTLTFHLCDSFEGLSEFAPVDLPTGWTINQAKLQKHFSCSEEEVHANLAEFDFIVTHKGWVPAQFPALNEVRFCYAHIDVDLYQPTRDSVEFVWPRLNAHGVLLLDDYGTCNFPGARKAIDEFFARRADFFLFEQPAGQAVLLKLEE